MTASVSDIELAALMKDLGLTPAPATPVKTRQPCEDPFCKGTPAACGWEPAEHTGRTQGGKTLIVPPSTLGEIAPGMNAAMAKALATPPAAIVVPFDGTKPVSTGPPPSTVAEMREVLAALDASRPRSLQISLGPSELGTPCQRQIAMKLVGLPRQPEDKRPAWAPMQGTAIHTLMEEALQFHNAQLAHPRWVIEERLEIDPGLPGAVDPLYGHGDAFDTDYGTVVDWKYVGVTTLREVKRKTIPNEQLVKPEYRVQGHLYGYGHERAGRDVRWIRLVFLARSHDYADSVEWTERYDPNIAIAAISRYYATLDLLANLDLANNPGLWAATPAAPGKACDWCPFRRIGGPADGTGCPGNTDSKIDKQTAGLIA